MTFKVASKRCDQCLYGPNKIVSDKRRKQILADVARKDSYFICHKGYISGVKLCCNGDWETRGAGNTGRAAGRLGLVEFVDPHSLKIATDLTT